MESSQSNMPRHPVSPVAPYFGGKRLLAKRLIERINTIPHELYAEPFVGMGGVFLRRDVPAKIEVINDLSRDVATLFRILQRHFQAFADVLKWQVTSRAEFERLIAVDPDTLTDLERAARFIYLQRTSYGGKITGRSFGVSRTNPARFNVTKLIPLLEDVHERVSGVVIECLPYGSFIERYDRPGALFYLDPPYWGCEGEYGKLLFSRDEFARLSERLSKIKGRFVLSVNDVPELRAIFAGFTIETVPTTYSVRGNGHTKKVSELVISNG